jgi:hypothetical protein
VQREISKLKKLRRSKLSRVQGEGVTGQHFPHTHEKADINSDQALKEEVITVDSWRPHAFKSMMSPSDK